VSVERIPTFGFIRGAIVRHSASPANMMVVRGLGETTAVLAIEGDEGGTIRLHEYPTAELTEILPGGIYALPRRLPKLKQST
jgi:hypothetical protein